MPASTPSGGLLGWRRRLGVLQRRNALDDLLLEEGLGRPALLVGSAAAQAQRLRGNGWAVSEAASVEGPFPQGPFEVVAVHGLEDAADPVATLAAAASRLLPRGRLVAVVENRIGLLGRRTPPRGRHAFTSASLRRAAKRAGLSRVLAFTTSCGPGLAGVQARTSSVLRPAVGALEPLWVASTLLHPENGEEVVLWAMR